MRATAGYTAPRLVAAAPARAQASGKRRCVGAHRARVIAAAAAPQPAREPAPAAPLRRRNAVLGVAGAAAAAALGAALPLAAPLAAAAADEPAVTQRFFLDLTVDGEPAGRVVVGVFGDGPAPLAARRFAELATGVAGVSFRRTQIDAVRDGFVRDAGVRVFSHADDAGPSPLAGGESAAALMPELTAPGALRHDRAGLVSLIALPEAPPPPPKERMVAIGGQLRTVREALPPGPNGTGFALTLGAAPTLDGIAVVVGRVLEGQEVLDALTALPTNRNADEAGLFFAVAKSIGDKRAAVAEKGFGRPLSKVLVAACGKL